MNADGRRIDRESAEQMLDAVSACPQPDGPAETPDDPLVRLLRAAAAPATEAELAGEEAAVAAFRAHAATPAPTPAVRPRIPIASLFSVKIASVALAVTAATGVVLVSSNGTLPLVWGPEKNPSAAGPGGPDASGQPGQGPSGSSGPSPTPSGPSAPDPGTVRLCRAYTAASQTDPQAASSNPAFASLVTRAGGSDKVGGYCSEVLKAAARSGSPGGVDPSGNGQSGSPKDNGNTPGNDNPGGGNSPEVEPPGPPNKPDKDKPEKPQVTPRRGSPDTAGGQEDVTGSPSLGGRGRTSVESPLY